MWFVFGIIVLAIIFGALHSIGVQILKNIAEDNDSGLASTLTRLNTNRAQRASDWSTDRGSTVEERTQRRRGQVFNDSVSEELQQQAQDLVNQVLREMPDNNGNGWSGASTTQNGIINDRGVVDNTSNQVSTSPNEPNEPEEVVPPRNFDAIDDLEL